jgi:hypothetical protein
MTGIWLLLTGDVAIIEAENVAQLVRPRERLSGVEAGALGVEAIVRAVPEYAAARRLKDLDFTRPRPVDLYIDLVGARV